MSREKRNAADRYVLYGLAGACVAAAALRVVLGTALDIEVLYFLLGAAAIVVLDSIKKLKFGQVEMERFEKLEDRVAELADVAVTEYEAPTARLANGGPPVKAKEAPSGAGAPPAAAFDFEAEVAALATRLYPMGLRWSDDPVARLDAPSSAGGSELTAKVLPSKNYADAFRVLVRVTVGESEADRRDRRVAFFLHQTFPDPVRVVEIEDRTARLTLISRGTFTVGALLPDGTRLTLELCSGDLEALTRAQRALFEST